MQIDNLVILAGGQATRLRPVTETIPKSMIDIAGKPFIHHQLNLIKRKGIKEVVVCAGLMGEQIEHYAGSGEKYGIKIRYSFDGDKLLGTGGAVKKALHMLPQNFFVMYGDSYLDTDFKSINEYFLKQNLPGLMTVYKNEGKYDRSNIEFENGKILNYDKQNQNEKMNYIDYGLGILSQNAIDDFKNTKIFDLELVYKNLLKKNLLSVFVVKERFYEIGSFPGLEETIKKLSE